MIRTVIVDDEANAIRSLATQLNKLSHVQIVATCLTVEEAKSAIGIHHPDLLFLDVELTGSTGFDLLQDISDYSFDVVFTTAYEQYALKAIKASALDYLLKPIKFEDLEKAVEKCTKKKGHDSVIKQVEVLFEHYKPSKKIESIALPAQDGIAFIRISEILRLEADSNYTTFYIANNKKLIVSKTLKEYEDVLCSNGFCRIHSSHIINLNHLDKYIKGDGGYVRLRDGSTVPVSRHRKEELLKILSS